MRFRKRKCVMNYVKRTIENEILSATKRSPVVMVCGPRQVGKSTMLRQLDKNRTYVSLRDPCALKLATEDPHYFFEKFKPPVLIDDFQLAPTLLSTVQYFADEKKRIGDDNSGMFWLSGVQKFTLMKSANESLVGRCAPYDMSSLSTDELEKKNLGVFSPDLEDLKKRVQNFTPKSPDQIFERICQGSMPRLCVSNDTPRESYYSDYRNLYLMRDVMDLVQIKKPSEFQDFLSCIASCTGQELNCFDIAQKLQISSPTVKKWINALIVLGVICVIPPYVSLKSDRVIKSSKMYFMDTGFASYLCNLNTPEDIKNSDMANSLFETYVVSEIVKSYYNTHTDLNLYHYRTKEKKEIDLIITQGKKLYPVEIRLNRTPYKTDNTFSILDREEMDVQPGIIICLSDVLMPYGNRAWLYPVAAI